MNKYFILGVLISCSVVVFSQEKITVEPTAINSLNGEYAPVYYKNGLVFSSVSDNNESKSMTGLYFIPFKKNQFGKKVSFSAALKTGVHEGAITFSADEKTAYFTRTQSEAKELNDSITKENKLGVFRATYNGIDWENIVPCNFNTPEYSFGHPSLSLDGKRLYISSDIEGGFGGKDIYYSEITDGVCGSLINLGKEINSAANEFFPFIDAAGKLYFSSDKIGGFGGLDIYTSVFLDTQWSVPELLDSSINSAFDDFSIVWHKNGKEAYFASNRSGTDDIFKITIDYPAFTNCEELKEEQLCYEFYEEATLNVDSVEMIYEWDFGDGTKDNSLGSSHCFNKPGIYPIQLSILDKVIGEKHKELASFELEIKEVFQPSISTPDILIVGEEFNVTVKQGKWKEYAIENFYIDYNDSTITKNKGLSHRYEVAGNKVLRILITGRDVTTHEIKKNCFYKTITVKEK